MLDLEQKLLQLLVVTLELLALDGELVAFGRAEALLRNATVLELALAEHRQRNLKHRLAELVQVFRRQAVDSLPLEVDDARVLHTQHVVCHRQIQRELLVELGRHGSLLIFLDRVQLLHAREKAPLVGCLSTCAGLTLQTQVVENQLKFLRQSDIESENLSAQIQHNVEHLRQSALLVTCASLLQLLHQTEVILFGLIGGSEYHEAVFEERLGIFLEKGFIGGQDFLNCADFVGVVFKNRVHF